MGQGEASSVEIKKRVRQRCCLPHILSNLYGEWKLKEALQDIEDSTVGDRRINTINHAHNLVVLTKTEERQRY